MIQDYLFPKDVSEAMQMLRDNQGDARIIAGGTDLVIDLEEKRCSAQCVVDITRIEELSRIEESEGMIRIGASATCTQIENSRLLAEKAPALVAGARKLGSRQIRNIATIGGNIVKAQPAADTAVPLVALGAKAVIAGVEEEQTIPVQDLYAGFARSIVDSTCQCLTHFIVPAHSESQGSGYYRLDKRGSLSLPMLNVACMLSLKNDAIEYARIAMGPVGPGPQRALDAEKALVNIAPSPENLAKAARLAVNHANPRSSAVRGGREYRMAVLPTIVERAITSALAHARR